jgi:hypothetical protein
MCASRLMRARSTIGRLSLPLLVVMAVALVGCTDDQAADSATSADGEAADREPLREEVPRSGDEPTTTEAAPPLPRSVGRVTAADVAPEPEDDDAPSNDRPLTELRVGDCVDLPVASTPSEADEQDLPADTEVLLATLIPCDEPHDAEVYARISLDENPEATFPGDEAVLAGADGVCLEAFEAYVGAPYVDTELEIVHLRPNEAAWVRGDRVVVCAVVSIDLQPLVERVGSDA